MHFLLLHVHIHLYEWRGCGQPYASILDLGLVDEYMKCMRAKRHLYIASLVALYLNGLEIINMDDYPISWILDGLYLEQWSWIIESKDDVSFFLSLAQYGLLVYYISQSP